MLHKWLGRFSSSFHIVFHKFYVKEVIEKAFLYLLEEVMRMTFNWADIINLLQLMVGIISLIIQIKKK